MKTVETKFGTYIDMETKSNTEITGDKIRVYRDWETDRKSTRLNSSH